MRHAALLMLPMLLAACAARPPAPPSPFGGNPIHAETRQLTLDLRYRMGETLSLETQVVLLNGRSLVSTRLKDCGMTPGNEFIRFTTGGRINPDQPCRLVITPPGEPSQLFDLAIPRRNPELAVWSPWTRPVAQLVSPMPAQTLIHQPDAHQPLTVPEARQFELRHQVTEIRSPLQPRAD